MRIIVLVSDRNLWALRPFAWLLERYWPGPEVLVAGFSAPDFELPGRFGFYSIGRFEDFPTERWSDALHLLLEREVLESHFILMLEDYWLTRSVDIEAVRWLTAVAEAEADVQRIDLTTDRLYAAGVHDVGPFGRLDLIQSDPASEYHMSLQAAIWNRTHLLDLLCPGETPWQFELQGTERLRLRPDLRVLGTRQAPVRYVIGIRNGRPSIDGRWQFPPKWLQSSDITRMRAQGVLPEAVG